MARRCTDVCTTSGSRPPLAISFPAATAWRTPRLLSPTSIQPVNRSSAFHSLSPCRNSTSSAIGQPPAVPAPLAGGNRQARRVPDRGADAVAGGRGGLALWSGIAVEGGALAQRPAERLGDGAQVADRLE